MAANRKNKSLAQITAETKPKRELVAVCVAGDLVTEHAHLNRELEEHEAKAVGRSKKLAETADDSKGDALAERIRKLEAKIEERTYDFEFEKIEDPGWFDLMDEHPPRKGKERQERWNPKTFPQAAVRASCVSPEGMDDDETFQTFWKRLNDGQRDDLFRGARAANEVALSIPFSVSASARRATSETSSAT
jgi:hypothetical protein